MVEPDEPELSFQPSSSEKLAHLWYASNESLRRFWKVWSREYLLILRGRTQDTHSGPRISAPGPPKIGDVVLVEQEEFPRNHWPLGRILALFPAEKPRSAKILLGTGREWERPINQLVPLECTAEWNEVPPPPTITDKEGIGERVTDLRAKKGRKTAPGQFKWADRPPPPIGQAPDGRKGKSSSFKWAPCS